MEIDHHVAEDICVIVIHDIITNDVAVETRHHVISLVEKKQFKGITLSLRAEEISSLGIGCIIAIYQDLAELNLRLAISLSPPLHQKFTRAKLHRVLDIFTSEAGAIKHFNS